MSKQDGLTSSNGKKRKAKKNLKERGVLFKEKNVKLMVEAKKRKEVRANEVRQRTNIQIATGTTPKWKRSVLKRIENLGDEAVINKSYSLKISEHKLLADGNLKRYLREDRFNVDNLYERINSFEEVVQRMSVNTLKDKDLLLSKQAIIQSLRDELARYKRYKQNTVQRAVIPVVDGMTEAERVICVNVLESMRNSPNKAMWLNKLRFAISSDPLSGYDVENDNTL